MDVCEVLRSEVLREALRRAEARERIWRRRARWCYERQYTAGVLIGIPAWDDPTDARIEAETEQPEAA